MTARTWVGGIALAALALLGLAMAAAGPEVVPATGLRRSRLAARRLRRRPRHRRRRLHPARARRAARLRRGAGLRRGAAGPAALGGDLRCCSAAFAIAPPLLSLDVFSYLSYARLDALGGLNPYEAVPGDLPGDAALPYVLDNRDVVSAYGPLFSLLGPAARAPRAGHRRLRAEGARGPVGAGDRLARRAHGGRARPRPPPGRGADRPQPPGARPRGRAALTTTR